MRCSLGLIAVLAAAPGCDGPPHSTTPAPHAETKGDPMPAPSADRDVRDVIVLAIDFLPTMSIAPDEYRVFLVENVLSGDGASPTRWRIGFKRRSLVPDQPGGRIGKGGEVYVEVDTATRQAQRGRGGA
jgi:hypothetical protein